VGKQNKFQENDRRRRRHLSDRFNFKKVSKFCVTNKSGCIISAELCIKSSYNQCKVLCCLPIVYEPDKFHKYVNHLYTTFEISRHWDVTLHRSFLPLFRTPPALSTIQTAFTSFAGFEISMVTRP
jgi:hypothetical protein